MQTATLDSAAYDPIDDLNAIFSHPSTLASAAAASSALRTHQDELDSAIAALVAAQTAAGAASARRTLAAQAALGALSARVEGVRARAAATERAIAAMTADIKRLDGTKRNLAAAMTALKRLQMLAAAYERLRGLGAARQYRECAQLLQAVVQLAGYFRTYRSVEQIAALSRNVAGLQRELLEQICEDFEIAFARGEARQKRGVLAEACLVMDALGDHARARLVTWYCNTQLREYRQVFRGNDEAGSLDNISRRYSWFNRMLKTYDTEHAAIFPAHWRVNEMLANAFCEGTRDDFKAILQRSTRRTDGQALDVNLLLSCLQETLDFEHGLERRFLNDPRSSIDTMASRDDRPHAFGQSISEAFEPYMSLWVESQDKQLATLIPKYRQQPLRNTDEEFSSQLVISSSTELFHFYRLALAQCAKLSTGTRLLELSKTFAKYLDQYGQQVLFFFLGERFGAQGPPIEDTILILNTADYCYITCNQLEEKIKGRIDVELRPNVDLQSQADAFMGMASAAVRALVRKVEVECEPSWREMRNTPWGKLESVGDQSPYVAELLRHVREKAAEILKYLHKQQYARAFCDNLVDLMVNTYIANIVQCKPVSEVGAEQMLLDSYVLKKAFVELATLNAEPGAQPPAGFLKRVTQSFSKLDALLKTLQVRPSPPEALVQAYLIHIADASDANFRKVLDLKGIRKHDHPALLDLFAAHRAAPRNHALPPASPLLTPLLVAAAPSHPAAAGAAASAARFDPATFGSALMSAARDGVDRLGTPALGANAGASAARTPAASPPPPPPSLFPLPAQGADAGGGGHAATNLNENLKSIGKFFRRDVGGFGRFGRQTEDGKG